MTDLDSSLPTLKNKAHTTSSLWIEASYKNPCFFISPTENSLQKTLANPHNIFIEVGSYTKASNAADNLLLDDPDFAICLISKTAYSAYTPQVILSSLKQRFEIEYSIFINISTCLQEALTNAVIHGNLELESSFHDMESMDKYYSQTKSRLEEEPYKHRLITISFSQKQHVSTLTIRDEGKGFSLKECDHDPNNLHGRGIDLIKNMTTDMWLDKSRRCIYMNFTNYME